MNYTNKLLIAIVALTTIQNATASQEQPAPVQVSTLPRFSLQPLEPADIEAEEEPVSIFEAIQRNNSAFVHKYIENYGSVTVQTREGRQMVTPLKFAAMNHRTTIIRELLTNPKSRSVINIGNAYYRDLLGIVVTKNLSQN